MGDRLTKLETSNNEKDNNKIIDNISVDEQFKNLENIINENNRLNKEEKIIL